MSHPLWVRGLKLEVRAFLTGVLLVAPFVGAWIETTMSVQFVRLIESHPLWVRGLKPLRQRTSLEPPGVAPFVGAWIETFPSAQRCTPSLSRTLCGCVD